MLLVLWELVELLSTTLSPMVSQISRAFLFCPSTKQQPTEELPQSNLLLRVLAVEQLLLSACSRSSISKSADRTLFTTHNATTTSNSVISFTGSIKSMAVSLTDSPLEWLVSLTLKWLTTTTMWIVVECFLWRRLCQNQSIFLELTSLPRLLTFSYSLNMV